MTGFNTSRRGVMFVSGQNGGKENSQSHTESQNATAPEGEDGDIHQAGEEGAVHQDGEESSPP